MQVNNEDLYYIYIYINIYERTVEKLEYTQDKIEGILQGIGLRTKKSNFRQEQVYKSCLPLMNNDINIKKVARRNILTSSLVSTYPFIENKIYDKNGVYIGDNLYNNSLILLNIFDNTKYKNSNICIFGTSGAGKSFFTKLFIIRNYLLDIEQYIIDPEREYNILCKNLNGTLIKIGPTSNTYINILDIRENTIEETKGYLASKIYKLKAFFKLVFGEISEEEYVELEEDIIMCYKIKGITFNDESLYKNNSNKINIKPVFKDSTEMPVLGDLYNVIRNKGMKNKLKIFINGSLKFFNNYTNVEINKKIIIADIYELGEENIKFGMYLFTDLFWDKVKENRKNKKIIYLDEIWKLIGVTSNKEVSAFIYKIFKTIRKYGGAAVSITQDVSDLFSFEEGIYGKSILNNSSIKVFFELEEENILILSKYINISENEKIEIRGLKRGECLLFIKENHVISRIDSSQYEKDIIERGFGNEEDNNCFR